LDDEQPWIADSARVMGDVHLGPGSSVWFGAVIRADQASISVGARSNVQDNAVLHADPGYPLQVGSDVSIGHSAVCHGCTIEDGVLIGMGSVVMNGAVVGSGSTVAAGAVVPAGMKVPAGSLVAGVPAKVVRELSPEAVAGNRENALTYVALAAQPRRPLPPGDVSLGTDAAHRTSPHVATRATEGNACVGHRPHYDDLGRGTYRL
jgi:carbonic anhydrase/acetyltransferase-like protein (isoleucine patch superfamily)